MKCMNNQTDTAKDEHMPPQGMTSLPTKRAQRAWEGLDTFRVTGIDGIPRMVAKMKEAITGGRPSHGPPNQQ